MSLLYVGAGVNHFLHPAVYQRIVPPYLPFPVALVYLSGGCEVVFGLLLIPTVTRRLAAWFLIALLIAVFPANIHMTLDYWHHHRPDWWLTVARLPLQGVLIGWARTFTRG